MFRYFNTLRVRLVIVVLVVALPAVGPILYSATKLKDHERKETIYELTTLVRQVSWEFEQAIEVTRHVLFALARLPVVLDRTPKKCSETCASLLQGLPFCNQLGAVDTEGNLFCAPVPFTQPVNVQDRPFFQRALQSGDFAIGDFHIGRVSGRPTVHLAYPALGKDGKPKAVVLAAMELDWFSQKAANLRVPSDSTLTIIDSNGTVLTRYPEPEKWIGRNVSDSKIVKTVLSQQEGVVEVSGLDNVSRIFAFVPLSKQQRGAFLFVGVPMSAVSVEASRMLSRNLITLGIVTAVALVGAILVGNVFIARPVRALVKVTQQLASGDLTARANDIPGGKEINGLAQSFNHMAESLQFRETERKHMEDALRESETKHRSLVEQIPAITYVASVDKASTTLYIGSSPSLALGCKYNLL